MVFNVVGGHQSAIYQEVQNVPQVALIFGFLLTSFALLLEHLEYHSNSHTGITQLNIFGAYTGLVTCGKIFVDKMKKYFTTEWSCILCNIAACGETAYVVLSKMALTVSILF